MTLQEYYDALKRHDWDYQYSDDNSVWKKGQAQDDFLRSICKQSKRHEALWTRFYRWKNRLQKKIPARPK